MLENSIGILVTTIMGSFLILCLGYILIPITKNTIAFFKEGIHATVSQTRAILSKIALAALIIVFLMVSLKTVFGF